MKTFLDQDFAKGERNFGPDPLLYKKQGLGNSLPRNVLEYKRKIEDQDYMQHAIDRIAMELMHFLVK